MLSEMAGVSMELRGDVFHGMMPGVGSRGTDKGDFRLGVTESWANTPAFAAVGPRTIKICPAPLGTG